MTTMVPAIEPKSAIKAIPPARLLLHGIPWDLYELPRDNEVNWHTRMAYDGGDLELMSPSSRHEDLGDRFTLMLVRVCSTLGLPCKTLRSTTWKKPGKEADCCFYLGSLEQVRRNEIDLIVDPPPDLAVEVEISRGDVDILAVQAAIGVPEAWCYDGTTFHIHALQPDSSYVILDQSLAFPFLRVEEILPEQRPIDQQSPAAHKGTTDDHRDRKRHRRPQPDGQDQALQSRDGRDTALGRIHGHGRRA